MTPTELQTPPEEIQIEEQSCPSLSWQKRLVFGLIYALIMMLTLSLVGEVSLRILPLGKYRSAPFRQYDSRFGISLIPNMDVVHSRGCFTGHVVTNQWGFRDHARTLAKAPGIFRIALMGDSVVEGAHVNPDEVMNIQMQKQLQAQGYHNVEVMNFAVEGIGTTQEWLMYQQQVRQFHPDMVIVGFSDNDVMNNSSTLQPQSYGIHTWYSPYYNLDQNGTLGFQPVEKRYFGSLVNFLEKHSYLVYYGERVWYRADLPLHHWRGMPVYYGTYGDDPLDADWQQAWKVTGKVMARFRDDVQADGARFVLIPWPNFSEIDPQWRERLTRQFGQLPRELKPARLNDRLQAMAASEGITISSLTPYLLAYRDSHHLQWPYFSLPCDPHFSAMGHQVVAGALIQTLEQSHWLPSPTAN